MRLVITANPIPQLFVVESGRERFVVVIGIFGLDLFAFGEWSGTAGECDGVKGVSMGYGRVVDFGDETVIELLLLFGLGTVLTIKSRTNGR